MTTIFNNIKKIVSESNERMKWDEYFMSVAYLISSRSSSRRLHVGAVIVKNNRIISTGYNGFLAKIPHKCIMRDGHEQNTIHAEQNAIGDAAKRGVKIKNSTIYITHSPCINCTKFIISSGITKVIYGELYRKDNLVEKIFNQADVLLKKYSNN